MNTPDLNVKICCNDDQKITNIMINKHCRLDFFRFFYALFTWILLSVSPFSSDLNLLKQVVVSVIFVLFVLECFTSDLSGVFKLTTSLESSVPERMSTISV